MKAFRFVMVVVGLFVVLITQGCGSLNRNIDPDQLSQDDMAYAKKLQGRMFMNLEMNMSVCSSSISTPDTASKGVFLPPLIYARTLGYDFSGPHYGYTKSLVVWPIFSSTEGTIYDSYGVAFANSKAIGLYPIFESMRGCDMASRTIISTKTLVPFPIITGHIYSCQGLVRNGSALNRYEFLRIPLFGPMFAAGWGVHKFLWVPFGGPNMPE